jgi:RNA polymerase sigma factor (TIGR02999 family)
MHEVTQILSQIESGDPAAAEQLLPLVYDELRKLAAAKLAQEKPGQTLQATALVHEAYIRLVGGENGQDWHTRAHFLAAAAEAMRRILVENARRKRRVRHGGQFRRVELDELQICVENLGEDVVAISEVLDRLAQTDARSAEFVKLRYFVGLPVDEAAAVLGACPRLLSTRRQRFGILCSKGVAWYRC